MNAIWFFSRVNSYYIDESKKKINISNTKINIYRIWLNKAAGALDHFLHKLTKSARGMGGKNSLII